MWDTSTAMLKLIILRSTKPKANILFVDQSQQERLLHHAFV